MKRWTWQVSFGALACCITLIAPAAPGASPVFADGAAFTMAGSTQMFTLGALMANRYQNQNQSVNITTIPSTSQRGFDDACLKAIAVGMSDIYIQDQQLREAYCADMIAVPVAVSATPVVYNLPGSYYHALDPRINDGFTLLAPDEIERGRTGQDLYGQSQEMERSGDRESEYGHEPAGPDDSRLQQLGAG